MRILETKRMVAADPTPRTFAHRDVITDGEGRPVIVRAHPSDRERVEASIKVALAQGRIRRSEVEHFLALAENDPQGALDELVARPPQQTDIEALYVAYADATGITRPRRAELR